MSAGRDGQGRAREGRRAPDLLAWRDEATRASSWAWNAGPGCPRAPGAGRAGLGLRSDQRPASIGSSRMTPTVCRTRSLGKAGSSSWLRRLELAHPTGRRAGGFCSCREGRRRCPSGGLTEVVAIDVGVGGPRLKGRQRRVKVAGRRALDHVLQMERSARSRGGRQTPQPHGTHPCQLEQQGLLGSLAAATASRPQVARDPPHEPVGKEELLPRPAQDDCRDRGRQPVEHTRQRIPDAGDTRGPGHERHLGMEGRPSI